MINDTPIADIMAGIFASVRNIEGGYGRLIMLGICIVVIAFLDRKSIMKVCVPALLSVAALLEPHLYVSLYSETSYKRFFWILPEAILLSYAIVLIISRFSRIFLKTAVAVAAGAGIVFTGTCIYLPEAGFYARALNIRQVDGALDDLADAITKIDPEPTCLVPCQAAEMLRVADPEIIQAAGRNYLGYMGYPEPVIRKAVDNISFDAINSEYVFQVAHSKKYKFVITVPAAPVDETVSREYGYEYMGEAGGYIIYYNPEPGAVSDEWYITQYGPDWDQNYFYTIESSNGDLVIIDGGHYGNAALLRRIIRDHGYHVSAWIFTSLSDRNFGAAYDVLRDQGHLFTIDKIYIQEYTSEMLDLIHEHQEEWEDSRLSSIDEFVDFIGQLGNVTYVSEGEDYDLAGLDMHIYHTWDDAVESIGSREASNSALVFSVAGREVSMLFTSDVTRQLQDTISAAIGDERFDYITADDHGNWTFDYQWYDERQPQGVFIDEYSAAVQPDGQAYGFYSHCVEEGYNVFTFATVPNRVTIR